MTDPTPVPTTDITPPAPPRTRARKPRPEPDRELAVMTAMVAALDSLSDDAARGRVVRYLMDRTGFVLPEATLERVSEPAPLPRRPVPAFTQPPTLSDATLARLSSLPDVSGLSGTFDDVSATSSSGECVEMLTPDEWLARDYPDVKILDCDGWKPDEWDTPCVKAEFQRRLARCAVARPAQVRPVNPFAAPPAAGADFPRLGAPAERKA